MRARTCKQCKAVFNRDGGGKNLCMPCTLSLGICTRCKSRPQDMPGLHQCSRCWLMKNRENENNPKRLAKWEMRQIERDQKFIAGLIEKFKEDATANG